MKKLNILIVEDEPNLASTLSEYLGRKGFDVDIATNAQEAEDSFNKKFELFDVILMDIGLPDGNGLELAKKFREKSKNFVLLFLSALNDPQTKYEGLSLGAEDYITKPFDLRELTIRLERILKLRNDFNQYDEVSLGKLKIWFKKFELQDAFGVIHPLSQKECMILEMLYRRQGEVISRDELIENIWGENSFPSNRTVDNYIVKLRKWIDTDQASGFEIVSVRGIGYKLVKEEGKSE